VLVIPSIDIESGVAVKRIRGLSGTGLVLGDPAKLAEELARRGARRIHVVDLDGASKGRPVNVEHVKRIAEASKALLQVGGGLRTLEHCLEVAKAGARWLVLGTRAVLEPRFVEEVAGTFGGDRVIVALDVSSEGVCVEGWSKALKVDAIEVAKRLEEAVPGLHALLVTCVDAEGSLSGACKSLAERFAKGLRTPIIYAGGISSLDDVLFLKKVGVLGVVLGMALYAGRVSLEEAVAAAEG